MKMLNAIRNHANFPKMKCSFSPSRALSMSVFNRAVKKQQKNNIVLLEDSEQYEYLRDEVADRLVDRLQDIQRDFPLALDLGCGTGHIYKKILPDIGIGGIETLIQTDISEKLVTRDKIEPNCDLKTIRMAVDEEFLPFPEKHFDLVVSSCSLHWVNDLPSTLLQVRKSLKADGAFLGAMLGGETLQELRSAFILAEQERKGGISPHISPFAHIPDVGNLMQGAGFTLNTVDADHIQVNYPDAFTLMEHLRGMGENNALISRKNSVDRDTFLAAASIYQTLYGNEDGTVPATFQVIYMIGWSPDNSQPKPKVRGSATQSLKDI